MIGCGVELGRTGLSEARPGRRHNVAQPGYQQTMPVLSRPAEDHHQTCIRKVDACWGHSWWAVLELYFNVYAAWITLGGRANEMEEVTLAMPPFAMPGM